MNRQERRERMKDRDYRSRVKISAEMVLNGFEKMMEKNWKKNGYIKDDESLNDGKIIEDDDSDESLNY